MTTSQGNGFGTQSIGRALCLGYGHSCGKVKGQPVTGGLSLMLVGTCMA